MSARILLSSLAILVVLVPGARAQDDKVFRALTPEAAEKVLQDLKIDFKKSSKGDEHYFDFTRENYRIRLTLFTPHELLLDCVFRGLPIGKVNQWNTSTRVSRASWHKDPSGDLTILEYGLDIAGGATAGTIKQYITRFDEELKKYDKFVAGSVVDNKILAKVSDDVIENILKSQGINFQKKMNNNGVVMFDFVLSSHNLRLYNFAGKDLMIDGHFKKIAFEDANRYNLSRKFIRVVNYKGKDTEYTALECNLDCEAGVTESMIRHWLLSFGEDVRHFSEFAKKAQGGAQK